jgi:hypothetical protein
MHRRLLAIALMFATMVQGTALAYATTSVERVGTAMSHHCDEQMTAGAHHAPCCEHRGTVSCAVHCSIPSSVALPATLPATLRTAVLAIIVPDPGAGSFAEHDPPHPLRPPIV